MAVRPRIMIASEQPSLAEDISVRLRCLGLDVDRSVVTVREAMDTAGKYLTDLIFVDLGLSGPPDPIKAAERITGDYRIPVIFITGPEDRGRLAGVRLDPPAGCLVTPLKDMDLRFTVESALYASRMAAERHRAENALKESEEHFRIFMNQLPGVVFMKDTEGRPIFANERYYQVSGLTPEETAGKRYIDYLDPEVAELFQKEDREVLSRGCCLEIEHTYEGPDGKTHWLTYKFPIFQEGKPDLIGGISLDITARKNVEEQLRITLREKEVLLKEIHHRVKNNMQIICSLLSLQSGHIGDARITDALMESQHRVWAMALVHEAIYRSHSLAEIDLKGYIDGLAGSIAKTYSGPGPTPDIRLNIQSGLALGMDHALPCGLILNELIMNAFKHAFPDQRSGIIDIGAGRTNNGDVSIVFRDNGRGLPEEIDVRLTRSLGLSLVTSLVEKQLNGSLDVDRSEGTAFTITFPLN